MLRTLLSHAAGAAGAWVTYCAEGVVGYLVLLVVALATGEDAGGPLAGPFLVLLAAGAGAALTVVVVLPSVLIGEAVARLRWLLSLAVAVALLAVPAVVLAVVTSIPAGDLAIGWAVAVAATLLPLTVWRAAAGFGLRLLPRFLPAAPWRTTPEI